MVGKLNTVVFCGSGRCLLPPFDGYGCREVNVGDLDDIPQLYTCAFTHGSMMDCA